MAMYLLSIFNRHNDRKCVLSVDQQRNNYKIRALFQKEITTIPYVIPYWNNIVENIPWEKVWTLPHKYLLTNKIKEITFKLIHKCYPTKSFLGNISQTLKWTAVFVIHLKKTSFICFGNAPTLEILGRLFSVYPILFCKWLFFLF